MESCTRVAGAPYATCQGRKKNRRKTKQMQEAFTIILICSYQVFVILP